MKKILFVVLFVCFVCFNLPAQMPVLDVFSFVSLTQQIDTLYATYDHIMATIETVQNTYNQLKKSMEMLQTINFDDVSGVFTNGMGKDPKSNFEQFRKNYKSAVANIDNNINLINNVSDSLTKPSMSFNGHKYSIAGVFGQMGKEPGDNIFGLMTDMGQFASNALEDGAKGYAGKLSLKEKERLMNRYGLSPRNFYKVEAMKAVSADMVRTLKLKGSDKYYEATLEEVAKNQTAIEEAMDIADNSIVAQNRVLAMAINNLGGYFTRLGNDFNKFTDYYGTSVVEKQMQEEIEAEKREKAARKREEEVQAMNSAILLNNW